MILSQIHLKQGHLLLEMKFLEISGIPNFLFMQLFFFIIEYNHFPNFEVFDQFLEFLGFLQIKTLRNFLHAYDENI